MAERVRALEEVMLMLSMMKTRLQFAKAPVGALLGSLCDGKELQRLCFLPLCKQLYGQYGDFPRAWSQALQTGSGGLAHEDIRLLISLGEQIGTTDVLGQIGLFDLYESIFASGRIKAEKELETKGRVLMWAGICAGVVAAIVLL